MVEDVFAISPAGVGTDIEDISRFEKINRHTDNAFLKKIFTENELAYCFSKTNIVPDCRIEDECILTYKSDLLPE